MNNVELILRCKNINKNFDGISVVKNVNLDLVKGTITGLFGENGCGKTTLLNIICRLVELDSGYIEYFGIRNHKIKPYNLMKFGVARSFQHIRNFQNMSLKDNLLLSYNINNKNKLLSSFFSRKRNRSVELKIWKDAEFLFEFFGLEYFGEKKIFVKPLSDFSIGEQRVVELIRIFLSNPRLLLFDEPTVALSAELSSKLIDYMKKIRDNNGTIMIVSHDLDFLSLVTDEIKFMRNGEILEMDEKILVGKK